MEIARVKRNIVADQDFCKKKRERLKGEEVGSTSEASVGKRIISVFTPVSDVVMVELSS